MNAKRINCSNVFEEIISRTPHGIVVIFDGKVTYVNQSFAALLGRTASELIGADYLELIHPAYRNLVKSEIVREKRDNSKYHHLEVPFILKDGVYKHLTMDLQHFQCGDDLFGIMHAVATENANATCGLDEKYKHNFLDFHEALLSLLKYMPTDFDKALRQITERISKILGVERVGIWFLDKPYTMLTCRDLYVQSENLHSSGAEFNAKNYPRYFDALSHNRIIAATDAKTDPRTSEFTKGYLEPLEISSMLEIPIWENGMVIGVLCHEHKGYPRVWSDEEQIFAASAGDLIAIAVASDRRRKTEEKLRSEKKWSDSLIDLAPNLIVGLGPKSKIMIFNKFAEELTGYKASEVVGKPWIDIFQIKEDMRKQLYDVWDEIADNTLIDHIHENPIVLKNGQERLLRFHNCAISKDDKFEMMLCIGEDITEQRSMVEKLKESELKYRTALESANDAIMMVETRTLKIVDANRISARILGTTRDLLIGSSYSDFMSSDALMENTPSSENRHPATNGEAWFEDTIESTGRSMPVQISSNMITISGVEYYLVIIRDITVLKEIENALRRDKSSLEVIVESRSRALRDTLKQMEHSRRLTDIGTLGATVAHELRNPLGVIRAATYNIRRKTSDRTLDKHIDNIEKKILQSDQIISNLIDYARIKMPQYEEIDLLDILEECLGNCLFRYPERRVDFVKKFDSCTNAHIQADKLHMTELFTNIIDNALNAVPEDGGKIEISVSRDDALKHITLMITDNGEGIPNDQLSQIFDPFFTNRCNGVGLGLTVCQQVVHLHEGKIDIDSKKGKGTRVKITLPTAH